MRKGAERERERMENMRGGEEGGGERETERERGWRISEGVRKGAERERQRERMENIRGGEEGGGERKRER